jgi:hypothetical protein
MTAIEKRKTGENRCLKRARGGRKRRTDRDIFRDRERQRHKETNTETTKKTDIDRPPKTYFNED